MKKKNNLIRLLLSVILFLLLLIFESGNPSSPFSLSSVKKKISENMNLFSLSKFYKGFEDDLSDEKASYEDLGLELLEEVPGGIKVVQTYEPLLSLSDGIVVLANKEEIHILSPDGVTYKYKELRQKNVSIYQRVKRNHIIGVTKDNQYILSCYKNGEIDPRTLQ